MISVNEGQTNSDANLKPIERFVKEDVDNLNTSIKEEQDDMKYYKIKIDQSQEKSQGNRAQQIIKKNNRILDLEGDNLIKIQTQEQDAQIPTKQEEIYLSNGPESFQQKHNQLSENLNNQFNIEKMPFFSSGFHITSQEQIKLQKYIDRKQSLGYENFRKGFEAINEGSIELAIKHNQAKRIKKIDLENIENIAKCDCCGFPVEGQNYSLGCSVDEFSNFGVGFSLYFIYMKFVIILLLIAVFPFGLIM